MVPEQFKNLINVGHSLRLEVQFIGTFKKFRLEVFDVRQCVNLEF